MTGSCGLSGAVRQTLLGSALSGNQNFDFLRPIPTITEVLSRNYTIRVDDPALPYTSVFRNRLRTVLYRRVGIIPDDGPFNRSYSNRACCENTTSGFDESRENCCE